MRVIFSLPAEQDLESIGDYIAKNSPIQALMFVRELKSRCRLIAENPLAYRLRPELAAAIRSCAHGHYVIFFTITAAGDTLIVRILHGAKDLPAIFQDGSQEIS